MTSFLIQAGIVLAGATVIFAVAIYASVKNNARLKREQEEAQA